MNKLAQYLNQHLHGEVFTDKDTLRHFSVDNGPLRQEPEMVVFPYETNDIRKLLRFSWQLAEKGHKLPITARGAGLNATGGATSSGVILSLSSHMNQIFEYDAKQRLVRLQPGVSTVGLNNALRLQGTAVPMMESGMQTVGGVLSDTNSAHIVDVIEQVEIVLVNGDVLQTKRLSKRELSKIKGQQGFIADIYREVDGLIDENADLIAELDTRDASGYNALNMVKQKDGSLDLTPLFVGSQGTLGIISEVIIRTEYVSDATSVVVAAFNDAASARDALDGLGALRLAKVEYYDASLIERAKEQGKTYEFIGETEKTPTVIVGYIDDLNSRNQARKVKKLRKVFEKAGASVTSTSNFETSEFRSLEGIMALAGQSSTKATQPVVDNAYVPLERSEDFMSGLFELEKKLKLELPIYGQPLEGLWTVRPLLSLETVSGKQTLLKFIEEYRRLVERCDGHLAGAYAEGRAQTVTVASKRDEDDKVEALFTKLKQIFDPYNILNSGAKQPSEAREIAKLVRSDSSPRIP
ncbi:MAG TPA: FAD-binding oxidoreductase [Candidatus Saccharimonadales bacterium]